MGQYRVVKGLAFAVLVAAGARLATADDIMGEYEGTFIADKTVTLKASADVVAEGDGYYRIVLAAPGKAGGDGAFVEVYGRKFKQEVGLIGQAGGYHWSGEIAKGVLVAKSAYGQSFELKKIERTSPTAGLKPPEGAVVLLPFASGKKPDTSLWTNRAWKAMGNGSMQCEPRKGANRTRQQFSHIRRLHVEFKLPLEPSHRGQHRANSGVYLLDAYEVQVLDSFGLVHTSGDCGGRKNVGPGDSGDEMDFVLLDELVHDLAANIGFVLCVTDDNLGRQSTQLAAQVIQRQQETVTLVAAEYPASTGKSVHEADSYFFFLCRCRLRQHRQSDKGCSCGRHYQFGFHWIRLPM